MKKIGIISVVIFIAIIVGICMMKISEVDTEVTKSQTMVGMILNGKKDDRSWGQSHFEGMEKSAAELNLNVIYREQVPEDESSFGVIEELVDSGCQIIICNSFSYDEWINKAAEKYPDVYFFHATGVNHQKNLSSYFGRIYQIRYLSGIVAGLQTETNEIGYVAAHNIPEVARGINAFALGVRKVNPDAKVYVKWCNSWTEDKSAREATQTLVEAYNIDVLTCHTDSLEVYNVAEENNIWAIGYNIDNSEYYPNTFLTTVAWDWEKFYTPRILECLQGKFVGKHYWEDINTGMISLLPLTDKVKEGTAQIIEKEKKKFENNTFDVFYGPITDNEGNIRIAEGESMTDEAMLNDFDWFVEGVVLHEQ